LVLWKLKDRQPTRCIVPDLHPALAGRAEKVGEEPRKQGVFRTWSPMYPKVERCPRRRIRRRHTRQHRLLNSLQVRIAENGRSKDLRADSSGLCQIVLRPESEPPQLGPRLRHNQDPTESRIVRKGEELRFSIGVEVAGRWNLRLLRYLVFGPRYRSPMLDGFFF